MFATGPEVNRWLWLQLRVYVIILIISIHPHLCILLWLRTQLRHRFINLRMVWGLLALSRMCRVLLNYLASEYLHFRRRLRKKPGTAFMMTSRNQMSVPKIGACVVFSNHSKHMFTGVWNFINHPKLYNCQSHQKTNEIAKLLFFPYRRLR